MKEKFLNHYHKIGARRFVVGTVLLLIILDVLNGVYLKLFWQARNSSYNMALMMFKQMQVQQDLDEATILEVAGLVDKSFDFFLLVILVNNLFFYFFYLKKKLWAQGFVLFYTLTAGILNITMLFDGISMGMGWFLFNLMTIPLYLYLFYGVKLLKNETTLVPEKKAR